LPRAKKDGGPIGFGRALHPHTAAAPNFCNIFAAQRFLNLLNGLAGTLSEGELARLRAAPGRVRPARREARTPRSSLPRNCRRFVLAPLDVGACRKLPASYMPRGQGLPTHGVCWKHVPTYPWV